MSFILRLAGRELARQAWRLGLLAGCIAVGFAAFFSTYGFSGRVLAGIRAESRSLLGADLAVSSRGLMPSGAAARVRRDEVRLDLAEGVRDLGHGADRAAGRVHAEVERDRVELVAEDAGEREQQHAGSRAGAAGPESWSRARRPASRPGARPWPC